MSTNIDALYHEIEKSDGLDKLAPLERIIEKGRVEADLEELPKSHEDFERNAELLIRLKTRLYYLGYLEKKNESRRLREEDRSAIRSFQREAGITVDGWVGKESWLVLENLFSLEADSDIQRWTASDKFVPLLDRAVQLRLFILGLVAEPPAVKRLPTIDGLKAFTELSLSMNLVETPLEANYSHRTLSFLFDQDEITKRIYLEAKKGNVAKERAAKAFVVCNARIEFWLLGYSIKPNGQGTYREPARGERVPKNNRYNGFYRGLVSFAKDANKVRNDRLKPRDFKRDYTNYFEEFVRAREAAEVDVDSASFSEEVIVETITNNKKLALKEWNNRKSFAGRLWDGTRRALGWFMRLIRRAVTAVTSTIRNALRVIWKLSINVVGVIKAAIRSFPSAVKFYLSPDLKGSSMNSAVFNHDRDFDWRVYSPTEANHQKLDQLAEGLRTRLLQFSFSMRVVGILGSALILTIKTISTGYLSLFLAISRVSEELNEFLDYYLTNKDALLA